MKKARLGAIFPLWTIEIRRQNWSSPIGSPSLRLPRRRKIRSLMLPRRNRTEPSPNKKLDPPGC